MRRCRRPRARFLASRSEIRSPVYSAIFFRCANRLVAKQPRPLILDFLIESPGASMSFINFIVLDAAQNRFSKDAANARSARQLVAGMTLALPNGRASDTH